MPHELKPLAGRVALITGGNRGLGREIARAFVAAGASVMICAREMTEPKRLISTARTHSVQSVSSSRPNGP